MVEVIEQALEMIPSIITNYGAEGTTKTSFAITFPPKVAFYNLEYGGHRAWGWKKVVDNGNLIIREVKLPYRSLTIRYDTVTGYLKAWKEFTEQFQRDCEDPEIKTIVWDTGTKVWALARDACLEEVQKTSPARKQLQQMEYGLPNRWMESLFSMPMPSKTYLIITHHETDEYMPLLDPSGRPVLDEQGNPKSYTTGKKIPDGFKQTKNLSDWVLKSWIKQDEGGIVPMCTVEKSAYGFDLVGMDLEYPGYDQLIKRLDLLGRI